MRVILRSTHNAFKSVQPLIRRSYSQDSTFQPADFVILRAGNGKQTPPIFLGPLVPGKVKETHKGKILHDSIIGKLARDAVPIGGQKSAVTTSYRLHKVTLEEYVLQSRRIVTPIYPHDASLIVSLFDLHPELYDASIPEDKAPRIDVLEAGTGHGSLTLHLSRAIHAANSLAPKRENFTEQDAYDEALKAWKKTRRAVLHTIDNSVTHSEHASKTVRKFRRGQYHANVDFHVGDVSHWVRKTLDEREGTAFLTHAFLDLPNVHEHVALAAEALQTDGALIVFCPSITQINECALKSRREQIPLELERVVELGVNGGTGGRLWDIRLVKPRAVLARQSSAASVLDAADTDTKRAAETEIESSEDVQPLSPAKHPRASEDDWNLICRPKVGDRIAGGGFLALFKKKTPDDVRTVEAVLG